MKAARQTYNHGRVNVSVTSRSLGVPQLQSATAYIRVQLLIVYCIRIADRKQYKSLYV